MASIVRSNCLLSLGRVSYQGVLPLRTKHDLKILEKMSREKDPNEKEEVSNIPLLRKTLVKAMSCCNG